MKDPTIRQLIKRCHTIAKKKGFWSVHEDFLGKLMLVVSELGECADAFRISDDVKSEVRSAAIAEELADACIRIFDLCGYYKINLNKAILIKMEKNRKRPYLHGRRC